METRIKVGNDEGIQVQLGFDKVLKVPIRGLRDDLLLF